jgi:hypothetical protein
MRDCKIEYTDVYSKKRENEKFARFVQAYSTRKVWCACSGLSAGAVGSFLINHFILFCQKYGIL